MMPSEVINIFPSFLYLLSYMFLPKQDGGRNSKMVYYPRKLPKKVLLSFSQYFSFTNPQNFLKYLPNPSAKIIWKIFYGNISGLQNILGTQIGSPIGVPSSPIGVPNWVPCVFKRAHTHALLSTNRHSTVSYAKQSILVRI